MTVSELKNLITTNVYENTNGAVTGGVLQDVLDKMAASLMGLSTSSLPSSESKSVISAMADEIGKHFISFSSADNSFVKNLSSNATLASNMLGSYNIMQYASNFSYMISNTNVLDALVPSLAWKLATSTAFTTALANYGDFPTRLISNTSFISNLKSALGL